MPYPHRDQSFQFGSSRAVMLAQPGQFADLLHIFLQKCAILKHANSLLQLQQI